MAYHIHQIDSNNHKGFLAEGRQDALTGKKISGGHRVVICAGCRAAFLEDSWQYIGEKHCNQSETLRTVPGPPSKKRFTSKKTKSPRNFVITNTSKNGQSAGASTAANPQPARTYTSTNAPPAVTYTSTNTQSAAAHVAATGRSSHPAMPILGGVFAVLLGFIFISVISFALVRFAMSGNNGAPVNTSGSPSNKNKTNNRVYSSNSTGNRNAARKAGNAVTPTYSSSNCRLYNDRSNENKVFIRSECDVYDCDTDASRIIASLPDNTAVNIVKGVPLVKSNVTSYSWIKVEIIDTGQMVWVADTKIKCD
jgi:hypothetical protein